MPSYYSQRQNNLSLPIDPAGDAHDFCKVNLRLHAAKIGAANDKRKKLLSLTICGQQEEDGAGLRGIF